MTEQTTILTDAELNVVSGGWFFVGYHQAETPSSGALSSNVQKKIDETDSAQQHNIG